MRQIVDEQLKPHIEEYEAADGGFAFAFASAYAQWPNILKTHMIDEEKQAWIDKVLNGSIGAFGLTESNAGSDPAAMRTTAVYDEKTDEWVINGSKCFCFGAPNADYFIVMAWTDKTQRPRRHHGILYRERTGRTDQQEGKQDGPAPVQNR